MRDLWGALRWFYESSSNPFGEGAMLGFQNAPMIEMETGSAAGAEEGQMLKT
jgi:hypothetical protein